jgi:hypothetical protein
MYYIPPRAFLSTAAKAAGNPPAVFIARLSPQGNFLQ